MNCYEPDINSPLKSKYPIKKKAVTTIVDK